MYPAARELPPCREDGQPGRGGTSRLAFNASPASLRASNTCQALGNPSLTPKSLQQIAINKAGPRLGREMGRSAQWPDLVPQPLRPIVRQGGHGPQRGIGLLARTLVSRTSGHWPPFGHLLLVRSPGPDISCPPGTPPGPGRQVAPETCHCAVSAFGSQPGSVSGTQGLAPRFLPTLRCFPMERELLRTWHLREQRGLLEDLSWKPLTETNGPLV